MGSRIISIYCHHHPTKYWYDIDNRLKADGNFLEAQECGGGVMQVNKGDDIYILRRREDGSDIKYRCIVDTTLMKHDGKEDLYEHNSNGYVADNYFKADLVETYEDDCFPLEKLRELELVSKHYQLNGDNAEQKLLDYIESNKKVIKVLKLEREGIKK